MTISALLRDEYLAFDLEPEAGLVSHLISFLGCLIDIHP